MARLKNPGCAMAWMPNVGDFLVMVDMTAMAYGLKPVGSRPGPVAAPNRKLQQQGHVSEAVCCAAVGVLDGDGNGDLSEYYELIEDNPPPTQLLRHLRALDDE